MVVARQLCFKSTFDRNSRYIVLFLILIFFLDVQTEWCFCHYYMYFLREPLNTLFVNTTSRTCSHNLNISRATRACPNVTLQYLLVQPVYTLNKTLKNPPLQFIYTFYIFQKTEKILSCKIIFSERHHSPGTPPDKTEFARHTQTIVCCCLSSS